MATFTYDINESTAKDRARGVVNDVHFTSGGSGAGADLADETYNAILANAPSDYEGQARCAERIAAIYARKPSQFSAGSGQMAATWADRVDTLLTLAGNLRRYAPVTPQMMTVQTQPMEYGSDPYIYLPDDDRPRTP